MSNWLTNAWDWLTQNSRGNLQHTRPPMGPTGPTGIIGGGITRNGTGQTVLGSTQPVVPTYTLPSGNNNQGGGFLGISSQDWGTILQGAGIGWNIYSGIQNQKAANAKTANINNLAGGFLQNPNQDIQSILQRINPGQDSLMQFLRADPTRVFNTSDAFSQLEANDQRQIGQQASALRAGYAGLGQRFGTAAQNVEGRLRSDFAAQIAARNAGIAQSSFEAGQSRSMQAAQLLSQLSSGLYQQGNNSNAQLLAIMAGLPPQASVTTPVGTGLQDIGQLISFLPILQQLGKA